MIQKVSCILFLLLIFKTEAQTSVLKAADSLFEQGNYKASLTVLENVKQPTVAVLDKIAGIYQKVGNYSKSIEFYEKVYKMQPSDKVKEQLGKNYQFIGNSNKAIELFEGVLQQNSNNLLLKYNLAKLYLAERKSKKGIKLLEELSKLDSLNPNYKYQLGIAYEKQGRKGFHKSINSFLDAYSIDSMHLKSIYNLAKFYSKLRFKDSTRLFIDKGLKINPKSINFNQLKAQESFLDKEYQTTLKTLKALENSNFKTKFVYKLYGLTYYELKDYEKAIDYLKKARKLDYNDASTSYSLGKIFEAQKDYKGAEMSYYMSITKQMPKVDKNYHRLGMVFLAQNQTEKAIENFKKGLESNYKNSELRYQLAITADSFYKDKKIAYKYYDDFIERYGGGTEEQNAFAKRRIKEIKKTLFIKGEKVD